MSINVLKIDIQSGWTEGDPGQYEPTMTSVYFTEEEFDNISIANDLECIFPESSVRLPVVYDRSSMLTYVDYENKISYNYTITFNINEATTRAKVDQVLTCKNLITIYYGYNDITGAWNRYSGRVTSSGSVGYVSVSPEYEVKKYNFGRESANTKLTVKFYDIANYYGSPATRVYRQEGIDYRYQIIIDPDGDSFCIDGLNDLVSISNYTHGFDYEPARLGEIELNDIYLTFNNYKHFFENFRNSSYWEHSKPNPFRIAFWKLAQTVNVGDSEAYLSGSLESEYGTIAPKVYDKITLIDADLNYETFTVTAVTYNALGNIVTLNGTASREYNSSTAYAYLNGIVGKKVQIKLIKTQHEASGTDTVTATTIFKGIIRQPFNVNKDSAFVKVDNILPDILNKPLVIRSDDYFPYYVINSAGERENSIRWTTQTGSGTISDVTYYDGASPGNWTVTFSSATDFTVTGPNCYAKAGSTASDFYDQTDATNSQIKIATTQWGGTPSAGDVVGFFLCVNYEVVDIPNIIYSLLVTHGGATDEYINVTSEGLLYSISFNAQCTIGEAVSALLRGSDFVLTTDYLGRFILTRLKKFDVNTETSDFNTIVSLSHLAFYDEYQLTFSDIYNNILVNYGYNYYDSKYDKIARYPQDWTDSTNLSAEAFQKNRYLELFSPGIQTEAYALQLARTIYNLYAFGNRIIKVKSSISIISSVNPGDIIKIDMAGSYLALFVIAKDINFMDYSITYTCANMERTFPTP